MDNSLTWHMLVEDLATDDHVAHAELKEIVRWFPSLEMMRNHACGLVKAMTDGEVITFTMEVITAIPTRVNAACWNRFQPELLHHNDWSDDQSSSMEYQSDENSCYVPEGDSSGEEG
ncbi:hypothetical protein ZWY2020_056343 [Hordeum vulgare]|nr:hypothetical protein ZWY2020_056343 [Hordeum vulgare]